VDYNDDGEMKQINQYSLHHKLGQGSFAEVYLATNENDKQEYAAKIFNKSLLRRKRTMNRTATGVKVTSELDKVEKEIAIMKKLVHRNLVCLYEVIDDDEEDQLYMFIEYVEHGPRPPRPPPSPPRASVRRDRDPPPPPPPPRPAGGRGPATL